MKIMFASDIHGAEDRCKKMLDAFENERAERLVLLGDVLYHGPRNNLPDFYIPMAVVEMLNKYKKQIIAVRGNCDSEVDQMVLEFPIRADYSVLYVDGISMFLTHGHLYDVDEISDMINDPVYIQGHTHVNGMQKVNGILCMNPGSIGIPKDSTEGSYMIYEDGVFMIKGLFDGVPLNSFGVQE